MDADHTISGTRRSRTLHWRWLAAALCAILLAAGAVVVPATGAGALPKCSDTGDCGTGGGGDTGGGGGGTNQPPSVGSLSFSNGSTNNVADRTDTKLTLNWIVSSNATTFQIQRVSGSTATSVYSNSVSSAPAAIALTGLMPDTQYCYQIRASNSHGSSAWSPSSCEWTKDGKPGRTVFRAQLQITTGTAGGGGTDDVIYATLGGYGNGTAAGGTTALDSPRDDFEAGSTATYDLPNIGDISDLGDIHSIAIYKHDQDDWCIANATLLIDGVPVSSTDFGPPCQTIAAYGAVVVSSAQLRSDPRWASFTMPPPAVVSNADGTTSVSLQISRLELQQRIEAMTGDSIQGTELYWGDSDDAEVVVTPYNQSEDNVHMHMAADEFGPDPGVNIDFKLVASTTQDPVTKNWSLVLSRSAVSVDVDFSWWEDVLDTVLPCGPIASVVADRGIPFCLQYLGEKGGDEIASKIYGAATSIGISSLPSNLTATFDSYGNLNIVATLGTPKNHLTSIGGALVSSGTIATAVIAPPPPVSPPPVRPVTRATGRAVLDP